MADIDRVDAAVAEVEARIRDLDDLTRAKIPDITVSALIRDLDIALAGRFTAGQLVDVEHSDPAEAARAAMRLTLTSDDFIDLVQGRLHFATGWAKGRIKVDARFRDLLSLRRFL